MVDVLTERLDADVYSLRVADLYAPGFGEMMNPAREQKENNEMLAFQEELPDFPGMMSSTWAPRCGGMAHPNPY